MRASLLLAIVTAASFGSSLAHGQVNSEKLRASTAEDGFSGLVDGSLTLKKGNTETTQIGGAAKLGYRHGVHTPLLFGSFDFAEASGETYMNRLFSHVRWTAMWHERVGSEVFAQLQRNRFLRVTRRGLVGAGARALIFDVEEVASHVGVGTMLEHEELDIDPGDPHPDTSLVHRATGYLTVTVEIADHVDGSNTTFLQPRIDRLSDFRLLSESALDVRLTKHFSLVLALSVRYDSDPPGQVEKRDLELKNKVRVTF